MACEKLHDARFGPEARVSRVARNEGAMTSAFRRDYADVCIARKHGIRKTCERDEWVILRGHDQSGHADFARDAQRAGPGVVVGSVTEAAIFRGDRAVKFAQRSHSRHRAEIEFSRK